MERVGHYVLHEVLGRGGMGSVHRAVDARTGREVALKRLTAVGDPRARQRFEREARALVRLRHEGIVSLLDAGEADGRPWLALELVRGRSLQERLEREGPLPPREAVLVGLALARAVAHAHAQGVIHRDLKPSNVLLPDGAPTAPRLTDFGLVGFTAPEARLTATGQFVGSPGYWAPEQAAGRTADVGPATDVYGLGGVLSAALTGRP
ncbi:MAG: serine/threonine protein kinase, partial [Planctomycetota bacterium]|nr:serine/threonine protein kinase [Planctomycetota bacterium]